MKKKLASIALCAALTGATPGNWDAAPIDVHEWGVNTFDWNTGKPLVQDFPDYLYTDQKPGKPFPPPAARVRDLPADSGVRTKPILYFYPSERFGRGPTNPKVGVEMRFAYGFANAWWPQIHHYRTEEESQKAQAPNWKKWKEQAIGELKKQTLQNNQDGKAKERWANELEAYQAAQAQDEFIRLVRRRHWNHFPKVHDDERMQLVWEELTLHPKVPAGQTLPGKDLKNDHWAKIAREVDAAYVSNGKETERYLFYEGKTREVPAIALLPANGGARFTDYRYPRDPQPEEVSLVNIGQHPIYDVIAIYRDRKKGILWTGYLPFMPPRNVALRIPDFDKPREDDQLKTSAKDFRRKTSDRLIENLTAGGPVVSNNVMMRNPAVPQGPTQRHQLFPKEAIGLEKIWHDDFFEADGFTVVYRESPEYLDEAMPLNIFTSMYWHIRLSRCGLVLNRNLPLDEVHENDKALWDFQLADWNTHLQKNLKTAVPRLKKNRLLTLGQARFHIPPDPEGKDTQFEEIQKLFE